MVPVRAAGEDGSMKRFILTLSLASLLSVSYGLGSDTADAEKVQAAYDMGVRTYLKITPTKYNSIYKTLQPHSKEIWVEAARDACHNYTKDGRFFGPNHPERPFDCTSF